MKLILLAYGAIFPWFDDHALATVTAQPRALTVAGHGPTLNRSSPNCLSVVIKKGLDVI